MSETIFATNHYNSHNPHRARRLIKIEKFACKKEDTMVDSWWRRQI